jgi:hypothetical protein
MYFPLNWEFGSTLSKLRNFGGGLNHHLLYAIGSGLNSSYSSPFSSITTSSTTTGHSLISTFYHFTCFRHSWHAAAAGARISKLLSINGVSSCGYLCLVNLNITMYLVWTECESKNISVATIQHFCAVYTQLNEQKLRFSKLQLQNLWTKFWVTINSAEYLMNAMLLFVTVNLMALQSTIYYLSTPFIF